MSGISFSFEIYGTGSPQISRSLKTGRWSVPRSRPRHFKASKLQRTTLGIVSHCRPRPKIWSLWNPIGSKYIDWQIRFWHSWQKSTCRMFVNSYQCAFFQTELYSSNACHRVIQPLTLKGWPVGVLVTSAQSNRWCLVSLVFQLFQVV